MEIESLKKLRIESEKRFQNVLTELENQSLQFGLDEFKGHKRAEIIIKFDQYESVINKDGEIQLYKIRLGLYKEDKANIWINSLEPIGNYTTSYNLKNIFIDEIIEIHSKEKIFEIEYWIETLNKVVPERYCKRNIPEYEFFTYINHTISLFQGRNFKPLTIFIKRCLDIIESPEFKRILDEKYLNNSTAYINKLYYYLKKNDLIDKEIAERFNIEKRIKTTANTIYSS